MAIRLKWKNPNSGASVIRIYRGVAALDPQALPAFIAEFTNNEVTYLDEFPKYGESFYYMFSITTNGKTLYSTNRLYSCILDLGPGPKDFIIGDFNLGYFGEISAAEIGISPSSYLMTVDKFYKIARNGKILYIAGTPTNTTANTLRANKVLTSGITPLNDPFAGAGGEIREYAGRLYAPRVAKLFNDNNSDVVTANYRLAISSTITPTPYGKSELIDIRRITVIPRFGYPAKFSINRDWSSYSGTLPLATCDFASASLVYACGSPDDWTTPSNKGLDTACYFHPVIEYKGNA